MKSGARPPIFLEALLAAPAALFSSVSRLRGSLFDNGTLSSVQADVPVISIGNLTAGGTGKTPITSLLTNELTHRGYSCGIISRGYGARERGPIRVPTRGDSETAKRFGDEPTWLASRHPNVPVVIGGDRVADVEVLLREKPVQLILSDDSFQHRRLKRDLDLVVIDATEPDWHYRPLPLGRMREGFEALSRAHFVFLSKTNQASTEQLSWIRRKLSDAQKNAGFRLVEFESHLSGFVPLGAGPRNPAPLLAKKVVTMSAIGRPQIFEQMVIQSSQAEIVGSFQFPDHHSFSKQDESDVEKCAVANCADAIVITEKDAVKLAHWTPQIPCFVSQLTARPVAPLQELYEAIDRLVR